MKAKSKKLPVLQSRKLVKVNEGTNEFTKAFLELVRAHSTLSEEELNKKISSLKVSA
jgi:hypothetical protein